MYDTPNSGLCASKKSQSRPSYLTFEDKALSEGLKSRFWWAIYFAKLSPNVFSIALTTAAKLSRLDFGPSYFGAFGLGNLDNICSSKQMELCQQSEWILVYLHWEEAEFEPILIPRSPDNQGDASPWTKTHWVKSICRFVPSLVCCWSLVWLLLNPHVPLLAIFLQIHFSLSVLYSYCSKKHKTNCKE